MHYLLDGDWLASNDIKAERLRELIGSWLGKFLAMLKRIVQMVIIDETMFPNIYFQWNIKTFISYLHFVELEQKIPYVKLHVILFWSDHKATEWHNRIIVCNFHKTMLH